MKKIFTSLTNWIKKPTARERKYTLKDAGHYLDDITHKLEVELAVYGLVRENETIPRDEMQKAARQLQSEYSKLRQRWMSEDCMSEDPELVVHMQRVHPGLVERIQKALVDAEPFIDPNENLI